MERLREEYMVLISEIDRIKGNCTCFGYQYKMEVETYQKNYGAPPSRRS